MEKITPETELIENFVYHKRLLLYKGLLQPEELIPEESADNRDLDIATTGYGVANWYLENGDRETAIRLMKEVVAGSYWAAVWIHRGRSRPSTNGR